MIIPPVFIFYNITPINVYFTQNFKHLTLYYDNGNSRREQKASFVEQRRKLSRPHLVG